MSTKAVMIGGGSVNWTPKLAQDLFMRPGLQGSELMLVDTDAESLELLRRYCTELAARLGTGWTVRTAPLASALDGAGSVCVSISTGGLEAMQIDYTLPEAFGVYQTVGDTTGPGGISRTLRNVPVFLGIAREMERQCPDAWMVHVTNPLNQLTRAMSAHTPIRTVGLCHNYVSTQSFLAAYFGVEPAAIEARSVGVNHGTWLTDLRIDGRKPDPARMTVEACRAFEAAQPDRFISSNTTDDDIEAMIGSKSVSRVLSFQLYETFGVFPVGGVSHVAENFPFYLNDPEAMHRLKIHRKGVLPQRTAFREHNLAKVLGRLDGTVPWPEAALSAEEYSAVVESLHTGRVSKVMATCPNEGQVTNLPAGVSVETWALVDRLGVHPVQSGPIPPALLGLMMSVVVEMELSVEAAVRGDRQLLEQALFASPLLFRKDRAAELADRLLDAHRALLPQFESRAT